MTESDNLPATKPDSTVDVTDAEEAWYDADAKWPHQFIEYLGDRLAVRKPTQQALAGFSLAASKFVKPQTQTDITGLFIERHMSEASYDRMMSRMLDPDDVEYGAKSVGEIMGMVVKLSTEKKSETVTESDTED